MQPFSSTLNVTTAAAVLMLLASCAPIPAVGKSDSIPVSTRLVVDKSERKMWAFQGGTLLREFEVALGRGGLAPKTRQGDGRVPEGEYSIDTRNPNSAYHLSLRISYPTPQQVKVATERGIDPGGDIMIHGLPNGLAPAETSHRLVDWTDGCIAVTNAEIEWLWRSVPDGTPILINP